MSNYELHLPPERLDGVIDGIVAAVAGVATGVTNYFTADKVGGYNVQLANINASTQAQKDAADIEQAKINSKTFTEVALIGGGVAALIAVIFVLK